MWWPFYRDKSGYARLHRFGRGVLAHRLALELSAGPPPSGRHVAAHSCGNGVMGCVNPRCLRWATPEENSQDTVRHGRSIRGQRSPNHVLTEEQVLAIYKDRRNWREGALEYGVSIWAISDIRRGRTWGWLTGHDGSTSKPAGKENREP